MNNLITPRPELVQQWLGEFFGCSFTAGELSDLEKFLTARAAQWGADQELEACCEWLEREPDPGHVDLLRSCATALRAVRRPKPPRLKAQALAALSRADKDALTNPLTGDVVALRTLLTKDQAATIRRALKALPDD